MAEFIKRRDLEYSLKVVRKVVLGLDVVLVVHITALIIAALYNSLYWFIPILISTAVFWMYDLAATIDLVRIKRRINKLNEAQEGQESDL
ncbi:MAG: hypothetical protein ACTSPL_04215 [Candidatus Odinarchaeia archaeon]